MSISNRSEEGTTGVQAWLAGLPVTASQLVTTDGRKATDGMADMRPCLTLVSSFLPSSVVTSIGQIKLRLRLGRKKQVAELVPTSIGPKVHRWSAGEGIEAYGKLRGGPGPGWVEHLVRKGMVASGAGCRRVHTCTGGHGRVAPPTLPGTGTGTRRAVCPARGGFAAG